MIPRLILFVSAAVISIILTGFFYLSAGKATANSPRSKIVTPSTVNITHSDMTAFSSTFDFKNGTTYPALVTVDLEDGVTRPGSDIARVYVTLSAPTPVTVFVIIKCDWGQGAAPNPVKVQTVTFRPGDPLRSTVGCNVKNADEGDSIKFSQIHVPDGAKPGRRKAVSRITSKEPHTKEARDGFRSPFAFSPFGELQYSLNFAVDGVSDEATKGMWSTSLPHGRTQPANGETGYYGELSTGAVSLSPTGLQLHSFRPAEPTTVMDEGRSYPFIASVASAQNIPATHFKYGAVEWIAKMPSRQGSWPALWLLPTTGWPPEIDVYEGFTHSRDWTQPISLSSAIHGGSRSSRSFKRTNFRTQLGDFGLSGNLTEEFHAFQVTVTPNWITVFVDSVETARFANAFPGTQWYPLQTNAVKAKEHDPYDTGSGTMTIQSLRVWVQE